jgi:hypothetical protein
MNSFHLIIFPKSPASAGEKPIGYKDRGTVDGHPAFCRIFTNDAHLTHRMPCPVEFWQSSRVSDSRETMALP